MVDECERANTCNEFATELKNIRAALLKIAEITKWAPSICTGELEYVLDEGVSKLSAQIVQCEETFSAFQTNLQQQQMRLEEEYNVAAKKIKDKHSQTMAVIKDLPAFPSITIPHNFDKVFEIAARFDKLPDAQFARVLELAVAMRDIE